MHTPQTKREFENAIFKIFWERRCGSRFHIMGMKGIPLTPSDGSYDNYLYELDDNLFVVQPNILGTKLYFLGESIVPIVVLVPKERIMRCIGTGYFVSCSGLLITAAHVITDPIDRQYGDVKEFGQGELGSDSIIIGAMVPHNPVFRSLTSTPDHETHVFHRVEWLYFLAEPRDHPLPIRGLDLKINSDIAICKIESRRNSVCHQPLSVVQPGLLGTGMAVGSKVNAIGYPDMKDVGIDVNGRQIIIGPTRGNFPLYASQGVITERYPDNMTSRDVPTPGPCFAFSAKIPGGMSGAPIFDREGIYAHGVVSKGWEGSDGIENFSFGSMLGPSMHISIPKMNAQSLFDLQAFGTEGMGKFSGPDL